MDHEQNVEQGLLSNIIQLWLLRQGFADDHTSEKNLEHEHQSIEQSVNRTKGQQLGRSTRPQLVRPPKRPVSRSVIRPFNRGD